MYKILLVDDEPNIVLALKVLLESDLFDIHCCYDGLEAMEKVGDLAPDLVILDVMMPIKDGYAVAKYIRQQAHLAHTTILFLTAKGAPQDKMEGYDAGAEKYLVKPFDNDDILEKVNELLGLDSL